MNGLVYIFPTKGFGEGRAYQGRDKRAFLLMSGDRNHHTPIIGVHRPLLSALLSPLGR